MRSTTSRARASSACSRGKRACSPCLARGARKSRGRYGSALDLFAEGSAQLYVKPNRELHNLGGFEISRTRGELAEDIGRFTAASTVAELALRFAGEEASPHLYDTVVDVLDRIARSAPERTIEDGLAACWRIVAALGFSPELSSCAHVPHSAPRRRRSNLHACVRRESSALTAAGSRRADADSRPARGLRFDSGSRAMNPSTSTTPKPDRINDCSANSSAPT